MMTRDENKKKVILVLGGTGDVGSCVADAFERQGAAVCRHSFSGGGYKADLRETEESKRLITKVISDHKQLDVIVNAVSAPIAAEPFERKTWNDFYNHLNLQLKSAVETTHFALPAMKKHGKGKIINIASTVCVNGDVAPNISDYATAKYALVGLTKTLAKGLGKYNITVNAVSPSFIKNSFTKDYPDKLSEVIIRSTPLGRLATENDIAGAVLFLASDAADYITGNNIVVSGGSDL